VGGFAPPVPTAPTVNSGVRSVTQIDTASSLIRDVSPDVQFEHAEAAPLLAITKAIRGKKPATQRKFEMTFIKDYPRDLTNEAAADPAAASLTITEWGRLIAGMQVMNTRTNEVFLVTATPTTSTVAIGARANAQAMLAGDVLRIISNAQEEVHGLPAIRSQAEERTFNYTQWFETSWGASLRAINSDSYIGKEAANERKKAMVRHNQDIEEALINGYRYQSSTGGAVNSSELTFTGGCRYHISSNYWNLGGQRPTEDQLFEYLGYIFEFGDGGYSKGGTAKKIAFCSPAWLNLFESFNKQRLQMEQMSDKIGLKVAVLQSTVGELIVKLHPLFAKPGYRDKMLILDLNHVAYRFHQGLDTTIAENVQTPGESTRKHHIYTDCGLEFNGDERAHGWVEGLGTAVA
jgi:hypothetical protein